MASSSTSSNIRSLSGSCKSYTPRVENQKREGHCIFIHMADMVATTLFMAEKSYVQLSPGPLADADVDENNKVADFVSDPNRGLETIGTYPYERISRKSNEWSDRLYVARGNDRYYLKSVEEVAGKDHIKARLMENFLGKGPKYPCVGDLYTGDLSDFALAKERVANKTIFRLQDQEDKETNPDHSVLIVGIDVSAPNSRDHYVEVKNYWGDKYGDNGFTTVAFDVFTSIWIPTPN